MKYSVYMAKINDVPIYVGKGKNNPFFGKKHTEETKEKNRLAHLNKTSGFKDKKHTEEAKEKNRLAHIGKSSPKKLNLDEKLILYLRYEDKKTIKEISQIFNCSGYPIKQVLKRNKNG